MGKRTRLRERDAERPPQPPVSAPVPEPDSGAEDRERTPTGRVPYMKLTKPERRLVQFEIGRAVQETSRPLCDIAEDYGCSAGTISQWSRAFGWERPADTLVEVRRRAKVNAAVRPSMDAMGARVIHEANIESILAHAAQRGTDVLVAHQREAGTLRGLARAHLADLITRRELHEEAVAAMVQQYRDAHGGEDPEPLVEQGWRLSLLREEVEVLGLLTGVFEKVTKLERQAYDLDGDGQQEAESTYEERLRRMLERSTVGEAEFTIVSDSEAGESAA